MSAIVATGLAAASWCGEQGALCLTFDDRNFAAWERCLPLFERYGAHATFFVCGPIDARAETCMKKLSAAGHSVGLHGFKHMRATDGLSRLGEEGYLRAEILPQLSVCRAKGIPAKSFAYPMSARTLETDTLLLRHFSRLRAGYGKVGDKTWGEARPPFPRAEADKNRVHIGLCGTNPREIPGQIAAMLPSVAASNVVLTVYAHNIEAKGAKHDKHNIAEEDLEKILRAAKDAGVAIIGFDEL